MLIVWFIGGRRVQEAQSFFFRRLRFEIKLYHCLVMWDRTSCLVRAVVVPQRKLCAFIKWWRLRGFHDELRFGRKISVSVNQENILIWKHHLQKNPYDLIYFEYVCIHMNAHLCTCMGTCMCTSVGTWGGQRRVSESLKTELLLLIVSCPTWVLGTTLQSSARAVCTLSFRVSVLYSSWRHHSFAVFGTLKKYHGFC